MQGARREDDLGIPDGMLKRPSKRNAADAGIFGVAADGWREIRVNRTLYLSCIDGEIQVLYAVSLSALS